MILHPKKSFKFLAGLMSRDKAYTGPFYINLDITRRCNMLCLGCPYQSSNLGKLPLGDHTVKDIPFELIEHLTLELKDLEVREVSLIGEGEPLLHPRLFDIISAFKRIGCKVQLFTNGTLIDQAKASAILDSGLDVLKVTLWANSLDEFQRCHPGMSPQIFEKTIKALELLVNQKVRQREATHIVLNQPLNRSNYKSIEKRISLARSIGCDKVTFSVFRDWRGEFTSVALSPEEIVALCNELQRAREILESDSLRHNIDEILMRYRLGENAWLKLPCYVGWFHARIKVDGTVIPCNSCLIPMGNLNQSSFKQIWNGEGYRNFRKQRSRYAGGLLLKQHCDCSWCCLVKDNAKVHQVFKYIAPLVHGR
ncbi:MAG: radical SAM protein [Desulfoferrobacter sp.]